MVLVQHVIEFRDTLKQKGSILYFLCISSLEFESTAVLLTRVLLAPQDKMGGILNYLPFMSTLQSKPMSVKLQTFSCFVA